jgi:hypothetical protein
VAQMAEEMLRGSSDPTHQHAGHDVVALVALSSPLRAPPLDLYPAMRYLYSATEVSRRQSLHLPSTHLLPEEKEPPPIPGVGDTDTHRKREREKEKEKEKETLEDETSWSLGPWGISLAFGSADWQVRSGWERRRI